MKLSVFKTEESLSLFAAEQILSLVADKPNVVLSLASGDTPRLTYQKLVELAVVNNVSFSEVRFIGLDEWVGIGPEKQGSCFYFLKQNIFQPLNINEKQIHFFNGLATNLSDECERISSAIATMGGIDFMLVGVGMNGHVGFNEPGVAETQHAHVVNLDPTTRVVGQKYFRESVPLQMGITLGLADFMNAKSVMMMASGEKKSSIMKSVLEGIVTTDIPASLVRNHTNGTVLLDEKAAMKLTVPYTLI